MTDIGGRWFVLVLSGVFGFFGGLYGLILRDSGRRLIGSVLFGLSIAAFSIAMLRFLLVSL